MSDIKKINRRDLSRRDFIKNTGQLSGLILGASIFGFSLTGCEQDEMPFAPSGIQTIELSKYPKLAEVGGSILIKFPKFLFQVLIIRKENNEFLVVDATCKHQGCTVDAPRNKFDNILCPCHGSEYSRVDASVVWFPPDGTPQPLTKYQYTFDENKQTISIDFSQPILN